MEELSQKVQNAKTHMLQRRRSHEHAHNSRSVQGWFKGALEELPGKVRKASTHSLSSKVHEHTRTATTVSSRGRWKKGLGRFRKQAHILCFVLVHVRVYQRRFASSEDEDTTTLPGKMRGRVCFNRAMHESSRKVQNASSHPIILRTRKAHGQISGAMERYMRGFDSAQNSRCPATIHRQQ